MKKVVLLFGIFLLLSFQQEIKPFAHRCLEIVNTSENREIKAQFEESNSFPTLFGDIGPGPILISVCEVVAKYSCSNNNFKHLQYLLTNTSIQNNLLLAKSMFFGSSFHCIIFVPIYLQSENLLL